MGPAGRAVHTAAVAVGWALAGLVVTALSAPILQAPFFMFQFGAVVGAALQRGFAAGWLTMLLSGLGFHALFFAPGLAPFQASRLAAFALASTGFAALAARMRRALADAEAARARAEAAEAQARAIGAQQERLLAVVGHDLRNPLSAISATVQALSRGAADGQARGLARIDASARRMEALIRDLLDFARARQGTGLPVQRQPARLGALCRAALEEIRAAHPARTVALEVIGDDLAPLDPARVEQVITNLVCNALTHGAAAAPVRVIVRGDEASVRLVVANQGPAIAPERLATLFQPFRPGEGAGSVGLGLFIVDQIARAHGGRATASSGAGGTSISIDFPRTGPGPAQG